VNHEPNKESVHEESKECSNVDTNVKAKEALKEKIRRLQQKNMDKGQKV